MKEGLKWKGYATIRLFDKDGNVKERRSVGNLVTDEGFDGISQRGFDTETGSGAFNYVAIGSDDTGAATGNTDLGYTLANEQGTYAHTDGQHNLSLTNTFAAGTGTGSVSEYGVMNGSPTGQLFNRETFGTITKNATDSLELVVAFSLS